MRGTANHAGTFRGRSQGYSRDQELARLRLVRVPSTSGNGCDPETQRSERTRHVFSHSARLFPFPDDRRRHGKETQDRLTPTKVWPMRVAKLVVGVELWPIPVVAIVGLWFALHMLPRDHVRCGDHVVLWPMPRSSSGPLHRRAGRHGGSLSSSNGNGSGPVPSCRWLEKRHEEVSPLLDVGFAFKQVWSIRRSRLAGSVLETKA